MNRRGFLRRTLAAAVAFVIPLPRPKTPVESIREVFRRALENFKKFQDTPGQPLFSGREVYQSVPIS